MEYDAIVIGSGPGGYFCAENIAQLGGKVAIVEREAMGGSCTNWGCIPTKALHASSSLFKDIKDAHRMGITVAEPQVDFAELMKRKDRVVRQLSNGVKKIMADHQVEVIEGEASLKDKNTIVVNGQEYATKNIVLATGAVPRSLPFQSPAIVSCKELLALQEKPESLIIVGGGYIGSEFASILGNLGIKITVIEMMDQLVPTEEKDIAEHLLKVFTSQGIDVKLNTKLLNIENNTVTIENVEGQQTLQADKILVSIGMAPVFNKEELTQLGVAFEQGITINNKMQTSVPNIYAVGDVTAKLMLAHHAYAQGEVAAQNIMGKEAELDHALVPSTIFTLPEIASVGQRDDSVQSVTYPFIVSGKARASGKYDGFLKVYYDGTHIKGFSAIGYNVSDLVAEATLAIKNNLTLEQIKNTIHAHPTLPEAFQQAVRMALEK